MSEFPTIVTARQIVERGLLPCTEDMVKTLAKRHRVGRKLGRAYIFTPADINRLMEELPCPSSSSQDMGHHSYTFAGPSAESALTKALAYKTPKQRNKSASGAKLKSSTDRSMVIPLRAPTPKPR